MRVQECDVYVAIIGALYGGHPPTSQKSFAQIEYEAAITKDMPRLIFLTSEDFCIPTDPSESDTNRALQREFRYRLAQERKAKFFDALENLKEDLINSLALLEQTVEAPRPFADELNPKPNLGLSVHQLCDRGTQEDEFSEFFRQKIQEMPRLPHIYILRGEECENLNSLIDRFCKITIEKQLIPQLNLPRQPVACRLVKWPDPDSPHPQEALARRLFLEIAEKNERYPTLDAATFANLRLLTVSGMLALRHEIREKRWTMKVLRLIDWYCRFWDEVAAHHPMHQLMIFICILYPDGTKEHGWKALLPFSVTFGRVERDLVELQNRRQRETERNPRMCPIKRLPEVCCVGENHLMEWFSTQNICELYERERYREHLFANRDCVHMAHLEPELKKIVTNWRETRV